MRMLKLQAWCARRTSAAGGRPGLATDVNANSTSSSSVPDTRIPSPPTRCYKRFDEQMTITITGVNGSCNKIALRAGPGPIRAYFRRRAKLLMNSSGRAASPSGCPDRGSRPKLQFAKRRLSIGSSRRMRRPRVTPVGDDRLHALEDPAPRTLEHAVERAPLMEQKAGEPGGCVAAREHSAMASRSASVSVGAAAADVDELHQVGRSLGSVCLRRHVWRASGKRTRSGSDLSL